MIHSKSEKLEKNFRIKNVQQIIFWKTLPGCDYRDFLVWAEFGPRFDRGKTRDKILVRNLWPTWPRLRPLLHRPDPRLKRSKIIQG